MLGSRFVHRLKENWVGCSGADARLEEPLFAARPKLKMLFFICLFSEAEQCLVFNYTWREQILSGFNGPRSQFSSVTLLAAGSPQRTNARNPLSLRV
jgi:hypothetical protein